jgi:inner membrane transporter RhtA
MTDSNGSPGSRLVPVLMILVAMVGIQFGAALAKNIFPVVGAQGSAALRLTFAAVILCLIWRPWRVAFGRQERIAVLVYGLSLGGMCLLIYQSLNTIPLGIAIALEFTGPLAVSLLGSRRLTDFVWVVLAVIGIGLLIPIAEAGGGLDPLGVGYALGAGVCWFLYIVYGQKTGKSVHGGTATAVGMVVASLLAIPFGVAKAGTAIFDLSVVPIALAVAVLASVIPYSLEMVALQRLPAKTFGILMSLEPAIGSVFGFAMLGERLSWTQWLAIVCIIAASAGSTASAKSTAPASEAPPLPPAS